MCAIASTTSAFGIIKLDFRIADQESGLAERWLVSIFSIPSERSTRRPEMKFTFVGAVTLAVAACATPALAQAVIEDPGYCAQFYPNANCQNLGPGNPYTDGGYFRNDHQNGHASVEHHRQHHHDVRHH
jgi:hypothetical protein